MLQQMQDVFTPDTATMQQTPYWTSPAAYELAESLERWEVDPTLKIYLATAYDVEFGESSWHIMIDTRGYAPPKTSFDLHIFEEDNAHSLFTDIAEHFRVGIHCFDGRNFNVTVTSFRLGDLLPLLPTIATQRRRKLLLLID